MICPKCYSITKHVQSFSPEGNYEFEFCTKCFYESRHKKINFDNLKITQNKYSDNHNKTKPEKKNKKKKSKKRKKKL